MGEARHGVVELDTEGSSWKLLEQGDGCVGRESLSRKGAGRSL